MTKIQFVNPTKLLVNDKTVTVEMGIIINHYDLSNAELLAVKDFIEARKKVLIKSTCYD